MRIIAGKHRGRQLVEFKADHIRPTTDRVKETLFNKLMGRIESARVLDLFSGTGNLGLESLSREAAWVDFVENHAKSLEILKKNLALLKITENFKVWPLDAFRYIREFKGEPYDVVLVDPPFTRAWAHELTQLIGQSHLLKPEGWLVIEASRQERMETEYPGLIRLDQRHFGDKNLNFFAKDLSHGQGDLPG